MIVPRLGRIVLPMALCALIAILIIKLVLIVGSSLQGQRVTSLSPEDLPGQGESSQLQLADSEKTRSAIISESHAAQLPSESRAADKTSEKLTRNSKQQAVDSAGDSLTFIQQRENELRRKEEQLREKEERLAKIEKEVEQKTRDLLAVQKEIQAFRSEKQESLNTKVKSLSKIYGTMKPKEAAKLMENLDEKLVMGIISTMTPDEAASILSLMEVKKAAKISEALSGR
ncbi:MAG: hypothetical protein AAGU11_03795 [Syntrophobacteraceae bacterium]